MVDTLQSVMSREGLHYRFNDSAVAFMQKCVTFIIQFRVNSMTTIDSTLLSHFKSIKIFDSTSWDIAAKLYTILPGCGGLASKANCKIQLCYEYLHGALSFFEIVPGNKPDTGYTSKLPQLIERGELLIADLGYFSLKTLGRIAQAGAYYIFRLRTDTALINPVTKLTIDLRHVLQNIMGNAYQANIHLGSQENSRVACRLVCLRVGDDIAEKRRNKLRQNARKKGTAQVGEFTLFMAGWIVMVTNVPAEWLPAEMVRPLYGLRWQIELLFKQLKSVLRIQQSSTAKENRFRCEVLGKLIVAIIIHRIHANVNTALWNTQRQEISMDKLYKRIQERAFAMAQQFHQSLKRGIHYIMFELNYLMKNCRKLKQKSRLTTLQSLGVLACKKEMEWLPI